MKNKKDMANNEKAFPGEFAHSGMDLRDYFAIHAPIERPSLTNGEISKIMGRTEYKEPTKEEWQKGVLIVWTKMRYDFADAMMVNRGIQSND